MSPSPLVPLLDRLDAALGRCIAAAARIDARTGASVALADEVRRAVAELDALLDRSDG